MSLTTNGYHPVARCPVATAAYFKFANIAKGSKEYMDALRDYQVHLKTCEKCEGRLDEAV